MDYLGVPEAYEKAKGYISLLVDRLMENEEGAYVYSPLESKEIFLRRRKAQLGESLNSTLTQAMRGYTLLIEQIEAEAEVEITPFLIDASRFAEVDLKKPIILYKALGWSDDVLNTFYKRAKELYKRERYAEVIDAYIFLTAISPLMPELWIALAHAFEADGRVEAAEEAYMVALWCDRQNQSCIEAAIDFYQRHGRENEAKQLS
jgi:tetratricopeptide (TPR) repeat protein